MTQGPAIDAAAISHALETRGHAVTPPVITPEDAAALAGMFDDDTRFRTRIDMARHAFGHGHYAYFDNPLPDIVVRLRRAFYAALAPAANAMARSLGRDERYPDDLDAFTARCHAAGQTRPTPLMLRYRAGDYNRLHRDLYGALAFPFQVVVMLSEPGRDYEGGAFVLVENRPRQQAIPTALTPSLGQAVVFPTADRAIDGARRKIRASLRHGVSEVTNGERTTLGLIFHDAA